MQTIPQLSTTQLNRLLGDVTNELVSRGVNIASNEINKEDILSIICESTEWGENWACTQKLADRIMEKISD